MGDINTNIRINELETVVDGLADTVVSMPAFYTLKDHAHNDTIEQTEFNELIAAIGRGNILRTGKLTRTGAQGYIFPENALIVSSRIEYYGTDPDIIYLTTTCSILDGATATSRTTMLCDIQLKHVTDTVIRLYLMPQYAVAQS